MSRLLPLSVCAAVLILASIPSSATAQVGTRALELDTKISLGTVSGRIDHLAADVARKHVFVAELENNTMGVVDLGTSTLLRRITGLNGPQGVGYVASADRAFVASGGDGTVRSFRGGDREPRGRLDLGKGADIFRVDRGSGARPPALPAMASARGLHQFGRAVAWRPTGALHGNPALPFSEGAGLSPGDERRHEKHWE